MSASPRRTSPPRSTTRSFAVEEKGELTPDGRDYHVCFGTDGELLVSEIWDSQEAFEAFAGQLMPILEQVGIDPGEPTIFEVHRTDKR